MYGGYCMDSATYLLGWPNEDEASLCRPVLHAWILRDSVPRCCVVSNLRDNGRTGKSLINLWFWKQL